MADDSPNHCDTKLVELMYRRDGLLTTVRLNDGTELVVKNIAWGYDVGDQFAHMTTNVSPGGEGLSMDFFYSDAIVGLSDTATGRSIPLDAI